MMPWVIGAVVAYVGYKYWENGKSQNAINNFFENETMLEPTGTVKYPNGGTGYTQYTFPSNVVL